MSTEKPNGQTETQNPVGSSELVSALARELWSIGYKAACEADPDHYWNSTTWEDEQKIIGRKAAWNALARHWLKRTNDQADSPTKEP